MKKLLFVLSFLLAATCLRAQQLRARDIVKSFPVSITWNKTTLLLFPAPIHDGDRGNKAVLAERIPGVENVLKIKAGQKGFAPSNLHIITTDGKIYNLNISYTEHPTTLTYDLKNLPPEGPVTFKGVSLNSREIEDCAAIARGSAPFIKGVHSRAHKMSLVLEGIFIKDDVLFFRYNLKNSSQIRYDAKPLRFFIRDRKRSRRTAIQDMETEAIYVQHSGSPESAEGQTIITAFPKFTIAENKHFVTALQEQDGDRNLECRLGQRKLLQAKTLPDPQ